jgi:hypothetical protein
MSGWLGACIECHSVSMLPPIAFYRTSSPSSPSPRLNSYDWRPATHCIHRLLQIIFRICSCPTFNCRTYTAAASECVAHGAARRGTWMLSNSAIWVEDATLRATYCSIRTISKGDFGEKYVLFYHFCLILTSSRSATPSQLRISWRPSHAMPRSAPTALPLRALV